VAELDATPADLRVLPTEQDVARAAAERLADVLARAIAARRIAHLALTGGSSAIALYRELRLPAWRARLDWQQVHMWWGDERFVPPDHPESNAGLANRLLLAIAPRSGESGTGGEGTDVEAGALPGLVLDPDHVHPVEVDEAAGAVDGPERAAVVYAREMARWLPLTDDGTPVFDVILAGLGPDGHVMSIFPGSPALAPRAPIAMGVPAPEHVEPRLPRVTLSARVLPVAHQVIVMAFGASKATVVGHVLGGRRDLQRWPAQSALLPNALWLLDRAAAGAP
jgi:6-phosphogluconolactonase